tara:strand:+ start:1235 stop:1921 length:687 start_codon:yes stop_codon:yes gene_type:complete
MKLIREEINGIEFYHRDGFSDKKTFDEVIGRNIYQKKDFQINNNEYWIDCGGNVGAFALLCLSKGAKVDIYEPDPFNCKIIEKNLKLNNYNANIYQKALVHNDMKSCYLFVGNKNQVWRNSIVKKWNNKGIKVDCVNFDSVQKKYDCCKMDIEGAEIMILQNILTDFNKLVFEWSFDVDNSIDKLRNAIRFQSVNYKNFTDNKILQNKNNILWQQNWFPMAMNIYMSK